MDLAEKQVDDVGTTVEGKDLQVLTGEATKARLAVALTMTSKSQTEMQIEMFLFSLSPVSSSYVPSPAGTK